MNWYDHMRGMDAEMLSLKILEWCTPGSGIKGRPQNSSMQEETTGMREGN